MLIRRFYALAAGLIAATLLCGTACAQEKVKIRVYQGESNKASDCEMLGEFEFSGFRIGYRGEVRIEVTFEIDTNGIVNVTAADVETGQKTSCTIRLSSGLTEDMIKAATEKNARTTLARGEAAA